MSLPGLLKSQQDETQQSHKGEEQDRHRQSRHEAAADPGDARRADRHVDDIERDEGVAGEAIDEGGRAESREQGGDLKVGDQNAVEEAGRQGEQVAEQQGEGDRHAAIGEVERPGCRHRVSGDDRQVDAATDHGEGHPDPEDAQYRNVANQGQKIARLDESVQKQREGAEQRDGQQENDLLLVPGPARHASKHGFLDVVIGPWRVVAPGRRVSLTSPAVGRFAGRGDPSGSPRPKTLRTGRRRPCRRPRTSSPPRNAHRGVCPRSAHARPSGRPTCHRDGRSRSRRRRR